MARTCIAHDCTLMQMILLTGFTVENNLILFKNKPLLNFYNQRKLVVLRLQVFEYFNAKDVTFLTKEKVSLKYLSRNKIVLTILKFKLSKVFLARHIQDCLK